jgi:hypothetical protein
MASVEDAIRFYSISPPTKSSPSPKIKICYDLRNILENHREILIDNNIITDHDPNFNSFLFLNSSYELLKYLKEYVFNEECFKSIELKKKAYEVKILN